MLIFDSTFPLQGALAMKRIFLPLFALSVIFPLALNAQTVGVAEMASVDDQTRLVTGFVAESDPSGADWVVAEFQDCFGIVGYADAFVDHSTGDVFSVTQMSFEGVNADSLSINLYSANSSQSLGVIIVIDDPTEGS